MIAPAPAKASATVPSSAATSARTSATAVEVDEPGQSRARVRVDREEAPLATLFSREQSRLDELPQMVRHRGLRKSERLDEIAEANGLAARREQVEDLHAGGVSERAEER